MIPERLLQILRSCESAETASFPATEVFNEGWMLRLLLDALKAHDLRVHDLHFLAGSKWYSDARLSSPFRPTRRGDKQGEGYTRADGIIGHFEFHPATKARLCLKRDARQFVVIEAKMFSNLSRGIQNVKGYDQAARSVACMAQVMKECGVTAGELESVGFFVIAPEKATRGRKNSNLEECVTAESIRAAVRNRISEYEKLIRDETSDLRQWEQDWFLPLVDHLSGQNRLRVLFWEDIIKTIRAADSTCGAELEEFYQRCCELSSVRKS